jgi:hypothetical protein
MRKIALLIAAALTVSVPLVAMGTTDSYAAAKKAKAKEVKADPNTAFIRAVSDLARSLENPWPAQGAKGAKKGKKG